MATKREWLSKLKTLRDNPRALSPLECDELILLIGGTIRPRQRPEITVFGLNKRQLNYSAIASVVFGFLENAERVKQLKKELLELNCPDEIAHLKNMINILQPMTAKNRTEAERMASEWFVARDVAADMNPKKIKNALCIETKGWLKEIRISRME